jgi:predicted nucleotidyltransferase
MVLGDPNIRTLCTVARALGPLSAEVLFVGGATVGLLISDPAAVSVRPTDDVDCVVEVASTAAFHAFERRLRAQGFNPDPEMICRYRIEGIVLDVMPTDAAILGFANPWATEAFAAGERRSIGGGVQIHVITAPYFIATKLEAFHGRGRGDFMASHDIEDIVAVIDGRSEIVDEIRNVRSDALRSYLQDQFRALMVDTGFVEALRSHLPPDTAGQLRLPMVRDRFRELAR